MATASYAERHARVLDDPQTIEKAHLLKTIQSPAFGSSARDRFVRVSRTSMQASIPVVNWSREHKDTKPPRWNLHRRSSFGPTYDSHQFRDLLPLVCLVAACDRVLDAMRDMVLEYFFLDPAQRGTNGGDLRYDIDAIAILLDHFGEAAHLALDPTEALLAGSLDVFTHGPYIPLQSTGYNLARRI